MNKALTLVLSLGFFVCKAAMADTVSVVTFDNLPTGPSLFSQAGPAQTINVPGVATFTGGVVLGFASNFPANIYSTNPNVYGTADFGTNLSRTLTISVAPTNLVNEISFALFNGETSSQSYIVNAYSGLNLLSSQTFLSLAANTALGYVLPDLKGTNITSLTVSTVATTGAFDFVIDTVAFNESVQQAVAPTPEPSSILLVLTGLSGAGGTLYRRMRRSA